MIPKSFCTICGSVFPTMRPRKKQKCDRCGGLLREIKSIHGRQNATNMGALMLSSSIYGQFAILDRDEFYKSLRNLKLRNRLIDKIKKIFWRLRNGKKDKT